MAYSTPPTKSVGDSLTAADWNAYIRDNQTAGVPDIFTAAGDIVYASAADAAARLAIGAAHTTLESTGTAIQWGSPVQCRLHKAAAQSINNNSLTEITLDTEDADTDAFYPGSGHTITIPATGLYSIGAYGYFDGHATDATLRQIGIYISGTYIHSTVCQDIDASAMWLHISLNLALSATTTIRMVVFQLSGGALNFNGANLSVVRIR